MPATPFCSVASTPTHILGLQVMGIGTAPGAVQAELHLCSVGLPQKVQACQFNLAVAFSSLEQRFGLTTARILAWQWVCLPARLLLFRRKCEG